MPQYVITGPDGQKYRITAPEGASQAEVLSFAKQKFGGGGKIPKSGFPTQDRPKPEERPNGLGTDSQNFTAGAGRVWDQVMDSATQGYLKLSGAPDSVMKGHEDNIKEKRELDKPLTSTKAGMAGGIAADVGLTAIPAARVVKGAQGFVSPLAKSLAALSGAGALGGAYDGLAKPTVDDESRNTNAAEGAAWGAAGQAVGSGVGRVVKGLVTPVKEALDPITGKVKELYSKATTGQLGDKEGSAIARMWNSAEESMKSFPLAGSVIRDARKRGTDNWRDGIIESVRAPGSRVDRSKPVRDRIDGMQRDFGQEYDDLLAPHQVTQSQTFPAIVNQQARSPSSGLPPENRARIAENTLEQYTDLFPPGTGARAQATDLKAMESRLSKIARNKGRSNSPDAAAEAELTSQMRDALRNDYRSQLPLSTQQALKTVDGRYAPFKTVEKATTYVGNEGGEFTPAQLKTAVKARTPEAEFARGGGMLQDEAETGRKVFQDRVPDSGTIERGLWNLANIPASGIPLAVAGAGLTGPVRNALTGTTRAQILARKLRLPEGLEVMGTPTGLAIEDLLEQ